MENVKCVVFRPRKKEFIFNEKTVLISGQKSVCNSLQGLVGKREVLKRFGSKHPAYIVLSASGNVLIRKVLMT